MNNTALYATHNAPVVYACPAFDVVEGRLLPEYRGGCLDLSVGDEVALMGRMYRGEPLPYLYTVGTVVGYALRIGEDPIAAYEETVAKGEQTHWLNEQASCVSSCKRDRKTYIRVELGQTVKIEGRFFTVALVRRGGPWIKLVPKA